MGNFVGDFGTKDLFYRYLKIPYDDFFYFLIYCSALENKIIGTIDLVFKFFIWHVAGMYIFFFTILYGIFGTKKLFYKYLKIPSDDFFYFLIYYSALKAKVIGTIMLAPKFFGWHVAGIHVSFFVIL